MMEAKPNRHLRIRQVAWLLGLAPFLGGIPGIYAQANRPTLGAPVAATAARRGGLGTTTPQPSPSPSPGPSKPGQTPTSDTRSIVFNDVSPTPSGHDLSASSYVGYQVCAGCHGRLTSTRRDHTIIQEWEAPTNRHADDVANFRGFFNVYTAKVTDGEQGTGVRMCAVCHATGGPKFNESQAMQRNGFDPAAAWNDYKHNVRYLGVQCENCHGPGSQHVLSGGDTRFINRVPRANETCWNCHVHTPNEKGNIPTGPATDALIARYSSSMGHTHAGGALIAATGGYEYADASYDEGHNFPHTKIRNSCVTCHLPRDSRSPTMNHSSLAPKIEACRNCHSDARNVASVEDWDFVKNRQETVERLLIQLGGVGTEGADFNAAGGLLGNAADKNSPEYKRARWNYAVVINDASLGVHNYDYAVELLTSTIAHAPAQKPKAASVAGPAAAWPAVPQALPAPVVRPAVPQGPRFYPPFWRR